MRQPALLLAAAAFLAGSGCHSPRGISPLIASARAGDVSQLRALLAAGADPNLPGGINDWTPVMHAIHKNQPESVRALIDGGALMNARTHKGYTALMMAASYGNTPMVRLLLARGADPRAANAGGITALDAAVSGAFDIDRMTIGRCQTETVKTLLRAAPDLRLARGFHGTAAKALARLGGCSEVLRLTASTARAR